MRTRHQKKGSRLGMRTNIIRAAGNCAVLHVEKKLKKIIEVLGGLHCCERRAGMRSRDRAAIIAAAVASRPIYSFSQHSPRDARRYQQMRKPNRTCYLYKYSIRSIHTIHAAAAAVSVHSTDGCKLPLCLPVIVYSNRCGRRCLTDVTPHLSCRL